MGIMVLGDDLTRVKADSFGFSGFSGTLLFCQKNLYNCGHLYLVDWNELSAVNRVTICNAHKNE
jgi:hypothetical protein